MKTEIIGKFTKDRQLDQEWVELISEAIDIGISLEEIKAFLIGTKSLLVD